MNFFEATETQAVLRDVFAFIDAYESQLKSLTEPNCALLSSSDGSESPRKSIGDRGRTSLKPRAKDAPNYERKRRQRKKHERESLRRQVAQYEAQLELLRLRQTSQSSSSDGKWGWLDAAMQEEEKRREAEELNRRLKGCLVERLQTAKALSSLVAKESTLASRIQVVVGQELPFSNDVPTRFSTHEAIKMHLKRTFDQLYLSANSVFGFQDESSLESFSTSACVKKLDSTAGMCIELSSTTPVSCKFEKAAPLLWEMLLARQYFGPELWRGCYLLKTKTLTQQSVELEYAMEFEKTETSKMLDGVTLMQRYEQKHHSTLVWTSMIVQPDGTPCFTSQGWIDVSRLPRDPEAESTVRCCSRLSGTHFGIAPGSDLFDIRNARKCQLQAKSRMERVQQRIVDRVEQGSHDSF